MIRAGIDDYSMISIYGLCLFQDYNADISAETREIVSDVKDEILRDLHIYYRSQGLNDIELTTKMSKIMLLVPTLEHVGRLFRENFHLVDLFCMLDVPRAYK
uniref:NR LBD domain-containing protein n=1 Tax=Panagrolaimus sp. ES5 TaxID=591445 RepID=A0AC34GVV6_9BILA